MPQKPFLYSALQGVSPAARALHNAAPKAVEDEDSPWIDFDDVLLAGPRGLFGAIESTLGLFDSHLSDSLSDWRKKSFIGESDTKIGGLLEGVSQFSAGFVGGGHLLKGLAWGARSVGLASVGNAAIFTGGHPLLLAGAKGAIADFTVWDGHDQRLANLLQDADIGGPITDFLAADDDDPELVGRLKNAVEGAGIGFASDLLLGALRGFKKGKKALAEGATLEEATELAEKAGKVDGPYQDGGVKAEDPTTVVTPRVQDLPDEEVLKSVYGDEATDRLLNTDFEDFDAFVAELQHTYKSGIDTKVTPRDLDPGEFAKLGPRNNKGIINLFAYGNDGARHVLLVMERLFDKKFAELHPGNVKETFAETRARMRKTVDEMTDLLGETDPDSYVAKTARPFLKDSAARKRDLQLSDIRETADLNRKVTAKMLAHRETASMMAQQLHTRLVAVVRAGRGVDERGLLQLLDDLDTSAEYVGLMKSVVSEQARGLNALKMGVNPKLRSNWLGFDVGDDLLTKTDAEITAILNDRGGTDKILQQLEMIHAANPDGLTPGGTLAQLAVKPSIARRSGNAFVEYYMNVILSGTRTLLVNAGSGAAMSVFQPLEQLLGAKIQQFIGRDPGGVEAALHAQRVLTHVKREVHEMANVRAGMEAAQENSAIFLGKRSAKEPELGRAAISAKGLGLNPDSMLGKAAEFMGRGVRLPTAVLQGTDEFWKRVNYRSSIMADLETLGKTRGMPDGEWQKWAANKFKAHFDKRTAFNAQEARLNALRKAEQVGIKGRRAQEAHAANILKEEFGVGNLDAFDEFGARAKKVAEDATFTNRPDPATFSGKVARGIGGLVRSLPVLRPIFPFINTPSNILQWTLDRMDVQSMAQISYQKLRYGNLDNLATSNRRLIQDLRSASPTVRAAAAGRMATGFGIAVSGMTMASAGQVTGRGPTDPETRRVWEKAGFQPYSIKVGDTWVSYERLDPIASFLGTIVDIHTYSQWAPEDGENNEASVAFAGVVAGLAQNMTNKTYLSGFSDFLSAMNDPGQRMGNYLAKLGATVVVPNIAAQQVNYGDPYMREAKTFTDKILNRIPGFSDSLEPIRDVLGEPVKRREFLLTFLPMAYRSTSDDVIWKEMSAVGHAFTPPSSTRGGVSLLGVRRGGTGQSAYDRFAELHGEVEIGGDRLRDALRKTIKARWYQAIPLEAQDGVETGRIDVLKTTIQRYRREAWRQVQSEYPELQEELGQVRTTKAQFFGVR